MHLAASLLEVEVLIQSSNTITNIQCKPVSNHRILFNSYIDGFVSKGLAIIHGKMVHLLAFWEGF